MQPEPLSPDELATLWSLLHRLIMQPDWDPSGAAWATLAEAKRQVTIEIRERGGSPPDEE